MIKSLKNIIFNNKKDDDNHYYNILELQIIVSIIVTGLIAFFTKSYFLVHIFFIIGYMFIQIISTKYIEVPFVKITYLVMSSTFVFLFIMPLLSSFISLTSVHKFLYFLLLIIFTIIISTIDHKYCKLFLLRNIFIAKNIFFLIILALGVLEISKIIKIQLIDIININLNILLILSHYMDIKKEMYYHNQKLKVWLTINLLAISASVFRILIYN